MIFGIGADLLKVDRIGRLYERFGDDFATRILMPEELAGYEKTRHKVRFLAMRFAAKEAIVKALGTGFANGLWVRDVGSRPDALGKPEVIYSERGAALCERLGVGQGFVTLSDEAGLVLAQAVLLRA